MASKPMIQLTNGLSSASGAVKYNMTNDYMFRVVLQKDQQALKGLISSLLHLDAKSIASIDIINPIIIGEDITGKEYVLDLYVKLNDHSRINLEMQVRNYGNWISRSLAYLTREFGELGHGDDYSQIKPVIHIGFLDFTLFEDHPEFYGIYRMKNIKDGYLYSDMLTLSVIELNHINLATDEDRAYGIDKWASLFKATTWEEIKMIAHADPYITSAAQTMFDSSVDKNILKLCRRRQEEIDGEAHRRQKLIEQEAMLREKDAEIAQRDAALADRDAVIADKDAALADKDAAIVEKDKQIARLRAMLDAKNKPDDQQ